MPNSQYCSHHRHNSRFYSQSNSYQHRLVLGPLDNHYQLLEKHSQSIDPVTTLMIALIAAGITLWLGLIAHSASLERMYQSTNNYSDITQLENIDNLTQLDDQILLQ